MDGRNNVTTHVYDGISHRTKTTLPGPLRTRQWTYDAVGNVRSAIDSNNVSTEMAYDDANRMTSKKIDAGDGGGAETFGYNVLDQMVSHKDRRGISEAMTYDLEGRAKTLTRGGILKFDRSYDPNGNLDSDKDANGHVTRYVYDVSNHRTSADHAGESETWEYGTKTAFATAHTDGAHHRTVMEPDARERLHSETNAAGETTTYGYDLNNNRTLIQPPLHSTTLVYDDANRLHELVSPIGRNTYGYTDDDQLESIIDGNSHETQLHIDELGHVDLRRYADGSEFHMTYDGEGNLTNEVHPNGVNVVRGYDGLNREVSASYSGAAGSVMVAHTYDGNGNVESVTEQSGGHSVVISRTYYDQNWLKSEDVVSDDNPTPLATAKYFAGLGVLRGKSLAQEAVSEEDQQGIGFTGYQKEVAAGLYYAGARYYDPLLGRFDSLDPVHGDPGVAISFNPFVYSRANPVTFVDPAGRESYNAELALLDKIGYTDNPTEAADLRERLRVMNIEQSARLGATGAYVEKSATGIANLLSTVVRAEGELSGYGILFGHDNLSTLNNGVNSIANDVAHPIDRLYSPWVERRTHAARMKDEGDIYGGEYLLHTTTLEAADAVTALAGVAGAAKSVVSGVGREFIRAGLSDAKVIVEGARGNAVGRNIRNGGVQSSVDDSTPAKQFYNADMIDELDEAYPARAKGRDPDYGSGKGRRGSRWTREHIDIVRDQFLEDNPDYVHIAGGTDRFTGAQLKEEYLPGPGGKRKGSSWADLTFEAPDGSRIRINTVDVDEVGVMTPREQANFDRIFDQTGEPIIGIPKPPPIKPKKPDMP